MEWRVNACILRTKSQDSPVREVEINEMLETLFDDYFQDLDSDS